MRADRLLAIVLVLQTAGCLGGTSTPPPPSYLDDKVTTERVLSVLRHAEGAPFVDVTVRTEQGVVHLAGTVATSAARRRAEELAQNVAGVGDVVNRIVVGAERS